MSNQIVGVDPPPVAALRRRRTAGAAACRWAVAVVLAVSVAGAGCSSSGSSTGGASGGNTVPTAMSAPVDFSGRGPYPVGTLELDLGDRRAVVYYPADPAATAGAEVFNGYSTGVAFPDSLRGALPAAFVQTVQLGIDTYRNVAANPQGPFPVVLQSHGFSGFYLFESRYMAHLASWGFVAAAPEHKERSLAGQLDVANASRAPGQDVTDLQNTLARLKDANVAAGGPLEGAMNLDQIAATGHSAGGSAAGRLILASPEVKTFIGKAPGAPIDTANIPRDLPADQRAVAIQQALAATPPPDKPSMLIAGETDATIPLASIQVEYEWLRAPKKLAVVRNAGHNAFTDLCPPIRAQGGLTQFAAQLPEAFAPLLRLGEDGCTPASLEPETGYAYIDHLTVAQLRWVFGLDPTEVSLAPAFLASTFPQAFGEYRTDPAIAS
jgi:predicted dienelactone hydrolase